VRECFTKYEAGSQTLPLPPTIVEGNLPICGLCIRLTNLYQKQSCRSNRKRRQ
jgi:hypothetical protein